MSGSSSTDGTANTTLGVFAAFQPIYAEHGLPVFPISLLAKKPLVRHFLKMGVRASTALACKFGNANLAFASGQRSKITVLDVDSTDERVLADAIARHGEPRIIVRTGSRKYHGYYRYSGERRRIRPWPGLPIDLLGTQGMVVAPPSEFPTGRYEIIYGSLDDLDRLTPIKNVADILAPALNRERKHPAVSPDHSGPIRKGQRNAWLYRQCMKHASGIGESVSLDDVLLFARNLNLERCVPPMEDFRVMSVAASVWSYTARGENRFGHHSAVVPQADVNVLATQMDALGLLTYLRANEGPWVRFLIPNTLAGRINWTEKRLARARSALIEAGYIIRVKAAATGSPAQYQWGKRV